jgi:hypothetical protein
MHFEILPPAPATSWRMATAGKYDEKWIFPASNGHIALLINERLTPARGAVSAAA